MRTPTAADGGRDSAQAVDGSLARTNARQDDALRLARDGYRVFRCKPDAKAPDTPHGKDDATADPDAVLEMFAQEGNIGLLPPESVVVIDVDAPKEAERPDTTEAERMAEARDRLERLEVEHAELRDAPLVLTGNGGLHVYLALPSDAPALSCGAFYGPDGAKWGDVRGMSRTYVLAPRSTVAGRPYIPLRPVVPPADLPLAPHELLERLALRPLTAGNGEHLGPVAIEALGDAREITGDPEAYARGMLQRAHDRLASAPPGELHETVLREARQLGRWVGAYRSASLPGLTEGDAREALEAACTANQHIPDREAKALHTIRDGLEYGMARPYTVSTARQEHGQDDETPAAHPRREDAPAQQEAAAGETPSQGGDNPPQGAAADPWPDPKPLPDETPQAPVLDTELLPAPIHAWTKDIAERASIGLDWLVPGALVSLAAVVGNRWRIRPKRHDPWTVVPNFYGALVIGPGLLKSYALQQTTAPLRKIEQRILERYEAEKLRGEVRGERLKAEQEAETDNMRKALRSGNTEKADEHEARLLELKQDAAAEEGGPPALVVNDTTVERLVELVRDNPRGVALVRDELYGWYQSLHKQGRETDRAFFLEAHDGDKSYRQDRIRRGTITADIVTLSILGGIQPSRLDAIRRGAIDGDDADGLLQRLQILVWPDKLPPYRKVDRAPDPEATGQVEEIFQRLYDLDPARYGHEEGPGIVQFQPDAQELFFSWLEALEHRIRDPEVQAAPAWASYLGKTRSLMPSLALLLHLVDLVTGRDDDLRVSLDAAKRAAALTEYLEGHAAKLYAPELARRETAARRIVEKIAADEINDGVKVRDLYVRGWSGLDRDQLEAGLALLEELHWLRTEKVRTKGRPTVVLRLRPDIQDLVDGAS